MQLRELFKQNNKTAVLAFGRMQPITRGHYRLAETMKSIPGDSYIFLSHKQNSKTDPLNFETKLKFAKECFPGITVGDSSVRTIIEAIKKVDSLGYTNLVFVAGGDRVNEFAQLLNAYNNREYSFESIEVVNAGPRDPDADGIEGISARKLREAAINNDIDTFLAGTPSNRFSLEMFNAVRNSMIENNNVKKNDLMSAFEKFFPMAMKVLDINRLPKIKLEKYLDHLDQPSFGRFENETMTIYLGLADRHPIDILRTLAHELVHFKQLLNGQLNKDSGKTGSPDENEAHVKAGIIMRLFDKKYPEFFKSSNIDLNENTSHKATLPEVFDKPYKSKWAKSDYGDVDVLAKLPDGTNLSIMFNHEGDDEWGVEFYRNNSQEITGDGDAQKIFATVLNAIQKFVKKHNPEMVKFTASKEVKSGQNSQSRVNLYDRLVQRYAGAMGYDVYQEDHGVGVVYELTKKQNQSISESLDQPYPYSWVLQSEDEWAARARTESGAILDIRFEYGSWDAQWDIDFLLDGEYEATAEGDQFRIFATVVKVIKEWWKLTSAEGFPVKTIKFSADKLNKQTGKTGSRERLYNRFAQQFANSIGFTVQSKDKINATEFELTNPNYSESTNENFADGKKPGRKGLAKRSGVNTKASVSSLRKTAKNSTGEKRRMAHWLANMKAGRKKASESDDQLDLNLDEVTIDNANGWGNVPYNQNVDYLGLRVQMTPRKFLELASELTVPRSVDSIEDHVRKGGSIGAPFIQIVIPPEWFDGDLSKPARIRGHEGRNRMIAVLNVEGNAPIETHLFFNGGVRNRDLTPEIVKRLNQDITSQRETLVKGPWFTLQENRRISESRDQPRLQHKYRKIMNDMIEQHLNETRQGAWAWLKKKLPKWPDYVLRDWVYNLLKGDFPRDLESGRDPSANIDEMLKSEGLGPDTVWKLAPDFQFSLDVLNPWTVDKLKKRWGGASDAGIGVTNDAARHATQKAMIQKQGRIRTEPVILIKKSDGYELVEGWHRTIQHFSMYPNGYKGPAWVAVAAALSENTADKTRIGEGLTYLDPVAKWVAVFKASTHPKFKGKTAEQREKMARMAQYKAVQNKKPIKPSVKEN